ncbi:MAG: hypothetical protein KAX20_04460, partial [Candidatus Omnitrophica bacterium]|nr:hypothetical protein [Candidatus Omnitrophota bacterium]
IPPENVLMVGDEPAIDLESPRKAGINHCVIVDRKQEDRIVAKDGGIFIKTLKVIPEILAKL